MGPRGPNTLPPGPRRLQEFAATAKPGAFVNSTQETWVPAAKLAESRAWPTKRGWAASFLAVVPTEVGGWSAGGANSIRSGGGGGAWARRRHGAQRRGRERGGRCARAAKVHRPHLSLGAPRHLAVLASIGAVAEVQTSPCLVAEDLNFSPSTLEAIGFAARAGMRIMASPGPTCFGPSAPQRLKGVDEKWGYTQIPFSTIHRQ